MRPYPGRKHLYISLSLSFFICFIAFLSRLTWVFLLGEGLVVFSALLLGLFILHKRERFINFLYWTALINLGATSLGTLILYFQFELSDPGSFHSYIDIWNIESYMVALAQAYVVLFCAALIFFGQRIQTGKYSINRLFLIISNIRMSQIRPMITFSVVVASLQSYYLIIGDVGFGGFQTTDFASNPLIGFVNVLGTSVLVVIGICLGLFRRLTLPYHATIVGLILVELVWFFLFGRRSIVFAFLLVFIFFFVSRKDKNINLRQLVLALVLLIVMVRPLTQAFFAIRFINNQSGIDYRATIDQASTYLEKIDEVDFGQFSEKESQNLVTRGFLLYSLSIMIREIHENGENNLYGESIIYSFLMSTPSNYLVDKTNFIAAEDLYRQRYPNFFDSPLEIDMAASMYNDAFIDFGALGLFLYAFLFYLLNRLIVYFSIYISGFNILSAVVISGSLLFLALNSGEAQWTGIFTVFRNILVILAVIGFINTFIIGTGKAR